MTAQACVDCKASDRTVMLTQEAWILGKRVTWHVCSSCFVRYEQKRGER